MSYVLGYFCADGCMFINPRGSRYTAFYSVDKELILKVKNMLNSENKIGTNDKSAMNWRNLFSLQIGSRKIFTDLLKLGVIPAKAKRLSFPKVPKEYLRHFVRGYFDGDGCVSFGRYKRKDRKSKKSVLMVRFSSASAEFLKELSRRIASVTDFGQGFVSKNGNNFNLVYNKNKSVRLFRYMYYNVAEKRYLKRKFNKFQRGLKFVGAVA
ncbi:MAG: LAGLIDADG family homing endonuclease [Candidatus Omnitrophota bacterium]